MANITERVNKLGVSSWQVMIRLPGIPKITKISSLSIKGQKDLELTPKQIGTLTGRKPKTLETDRRQQREVLEEMKK